MNDCNTIARRTVLGACVGGLAKGARPRTILLRSSWQTVNIGDIAHTPGVLHLIEQHIPGVDVILWPGAIDRGSEPMLRRRFPKLRIVNGEVNAVGEPQGAELKEAFETANFFLHGSAAGVSAATQVDAWRKTGKAYGFYGIGYDPSLVSAGSAADRQARERLAGARFVFARETASLRNLENGIRGPKLGFAPDGTFSMDIRDDPRADAYLRESGLEPKRFIAIVPRLRYTPYHLIRRTNYSPDELKRRNDTNDRYKEADHAKMRTVVEAWVRKTGGKALLCPEMTYQLDIIDPLLYDPLPAEIKKNTVRRKTYWLPDEASSVYRHASAVVSFECHSPILAAAQGTPCIYVHQLEDGIKGHMWNDIGLGDWYFEANECRGEAVADRVLEMHADYSKAQRKVREATVYARKLQAGTMAIVKKILA